MALAVAAPLAVVAPPTAANASAAACPTAYPVGQVNDGMTGWGLTVSKGTTPERFTVKVQGVLKDGIAPGIDMILATADSPAIDKAGAIWAGMSGSPVYAEDGRLLGAVAYGFSGSSKLAGITPAKAMLDVLNKPGQLSARQFRTEVALPKALRQKLTSRGLVSTSAAADGLSTLPLSMSISGVSQRRVNHLNSRLAKAGIPVRYHRAGAANGTPAPASEAVPGGNFGMLVSYGTVTSGGMGTTTFVCNGNAVAFGHTAGLSGGFPAGQVRLAATSGNVIDLINDPTFGPYKLAGFGGIVGTLTQDRTAGIAARLGARPPAIPVRIKSSADGRSRVDTTYISRSEDLAGLSTYALWGSLDTVRDKIARGTTTLNWKVSGTAGGKPWSLTLGNRYGSSADATFDAALDLASLLGAVLNNPYRKVNVTGVEVSAAASDAFRANKVAKLLVKRGKRWVVHNPKTRLRLPSGKTVLVRVQLTAHQAAPKTVDVRLKVPKRKRGTNGRVTLVGGREYGNDYRCGPFLAAEECGDQLRRSSSSFTDLLNRMRGMPRNDTLLSTFTGPKGGVTGTSRQRLDQLVGGRLSIPVVIR